MFQKSLTGKFLSAVGIIAMLTMAGCGGGSGSGSGNTAAQTVEKPNIIYIVADDLGYSDVGAYGGEVNTPNIDSLASAGTLMTNFHANPACSPTRAAMLSGTDSHVAGMGVMFEMRVPGATPVAEADISDNLGYSGYLLTADEGIDAFPTKLQASGYHTYMVGKWHVANLGGNIATLTQGADFTATIPASRGFEKSFALMQGGASHYGDGLAALPSAMSDEVAALPYVTRSQKAIYVEDYNTSAVDDLPADFYSTTYYTDKMIEYIESNEADGKPYFAYVAYTAPHWPLQLPLEAMEDGNEWKAKFEAYELEYFVNGYDAIGVDRFARMKALGIIPNDTVANDWSEYQKWVSLDEDSDGLAAWSALPEEVQHTKAREMAVYSVMVEYMDYQIGRLLEHVDMDNTIVVFMSDNGSEATYPTSLWPNFTDASQQEYVEALVEAANTANGTSYSTFADVTSYENLGRQGSYLSYDTAWTQVSAMPFRGFKVMTTEGGIRVPLIVRYPGQAGGQISEEFATVMDVAPTFLELAGVDASSMQQTMRGESLVEFFAGEELTAHATTYGAGFELLGSRAYIKDNYKLFLQSPGFSNDPDTGEAYASYDPAWELYDLSNDPGETYNLIGDASYADTITDLLADWANYMTETGTLNFPVGVPGYYIPVVE